MNKVFLMGRLTKDVELKYSNSDSSMAIARYSLAVPRNVKGKDGKYETDFFNCVAFGKAGEFANNYFKKGLRVAVVGTMQTGTYTDKNGNKVYSFNVVVESQEFADGKVEKTETKTANNNIMQGFENMGDDELPFN